jgi:hypothetical protein
LVIWHSLIFDDSAVAPFAMIKPCMFEKRSKNVSEDRRDIQVTCKETRRKGKIIFSKRGQREVLDEMRLTTTV